MSDYTPTPEAVEAAARAIDPSAWRLRDSGTFPLDHPASTSVVIDSQEKATAALTAAGPIIAAQALPAAEGDAVEKAARAWHEAAEAMDDEGPQMGPWDDLDPHDRDRARRYMRAALDAAGVGALRAEVERLREISAAQPYETERELAVALDEAQRQLADLRAFASWLVSLDDDNPDSPGRQERRTVTLSQIIDRARVTLAGSGEQPGKSERDATPDEAHDIGYAKGHTDGYREALAEHPAPVVPDSTDVRGELLHVLDSHGIDTYIDGTGAEVGVQNLITDILAVVGQGVTAEQARAEAERRFQDRDAGAERSLHHWFIEGALWASAAVRPSGQEGS